MTVSYCGVYWIARKDELPENGTLCCFHVKWRKPDNICFGYFNRSVFYECTSDSLQSHDYHAKSKIDYWMPIPVLPEKERS